MGAIFTQPYRGRHSLSPIGGAAELWVHSSLSPIGGAVRSVLLGALRRYGALSPIGGALCSAL